MNLQNLSYKSIIILCLERRIHKSLHEQMQKQEIVNDMCL